MGQRHQAFLIARIRPTHGRPAHRCVGAFHHQWSLGTLPLRALYRFVELLRRQENAAVVRGELGALDGNYESSARIPATPCPYTVSLLGMAWTMDLEGRPPYASGVTLQQAILDANMGCWDGGECFQSISPLIPRPRTHGAFGRQRRRHHCRRYHRSFSARLLLHASFASYAIVCIRILTVLLRPPKSLPGSWCCRWRYRSWIRWRRPRSRQ